MNQPTRKSQKDLTARLKSAYDGRFDDVSAAVFVVVPPHGQIVSVNVEAEELTGYEKAELEKMRLSDIFREEDRQRIDSIFKSSVGLDFRKLFEHNVIVRKRSRRKVIVDMGFRRSAGGDAFVFTLQDITDLKLNEERVIRANAYTNSIINSIVELLLVVDGSGIVRKANAAASTLLGYGDEDFIGQPAGKFFPELPEGDEMSEFETYVLTADGRKVPVLLSRSLLRTGKAHETQSVIVAMDITERKKTERLLVEQQMMLAQSSKMSSLGEMASSIGHEINNPLVVVLGRSELLEMHLAQENPNLQTVRDGIQLINKMALRINKIVRGLQSLARDQRHDAMEEVDVGDIVRETLSLCEQRIRSKVKDFRIEGIDRPVRVKCRPTQISQVLLNLLNNSYDEVAGKQGSFIHLEVQKEADTAVISVTDSGLGIPDEVAEKLFTPFFTTKPVGKGTGIGLSVSKSLIEAHGGSLELDRAAPNTRFVIRLPACAQARRKAS